MRIDSLRPFSLPARAQGTQRAVVTKVSPEAAIPADTLDQTIQDIVAQVARQKWLDTLFPDLPRELRGLCGDQILDDDFRANSMWQG